MVNSQAKVDEKIKYDLLKKIGVLNFLDFHDPLCDPILRLRDEMARCLQEASSRDLGMNDRRVAMTLLTCLTMSYASVYAELQFRMGTGNSFVHLRKLQSVLKNELLVMIEELESARLGNLFGQFCEVARQSIENDTCGEPNTFTELSQRIANMPIELRSSPVPSTKNVSNTATIIVPPIETVSTPPDTLASEPHVTQPAAKPTNIVNQIVDRIGLFFIELFGAFKGALKKLFGFTSNFARGKKAVIDGAGMQQSDVEARLGVTGSPVATPALSEIENEDLFELPTEDFKAVGAPVGTTPRSHLPIYQTSNGALFVDIPDSRLGQVALNTKGNIFINRMAYSPLQPEVSKYLLYITELRDFMSAKKHEVLEETGIRVTRKSGPVTTQGG